MTGDGNGATISCDRLLDNKDEEAVVVMDRPMGFID